MHSDTVQIKKLDSARQMVWAEIYVPMVPDSQGDFMTAAEIEKTAHNFMRGQRMYNVDTEHNLQKNETVVIESFIARQGDPDYQAGAWVVGVHVVDPKVWSMVEKGEINAFSMYGSGTRDDALIEIEIPDDGIIKGDTHDFGGHRHVFNLQFNEDGKVVKGETDEVTVNGVAHKHIIKGGTITEAAAGHTHRYSVSDALAAFMGTK
jgi:hypothetical protein